MPHFKYRGRDRNGQIVEGIMQASSPSNVALKLARVEVIPVEITTSNTVVTVEHILEQYFGWGRPKVDVLIIFVQQMHSLILAGVPLIRALRVIAGTTKHTALRNGVTDVVISLESGYTLSVALRKHALYFPKLFIAMVEVGENTGQLESALMHLQHYLESELQTQRRIKTALRYPLIVIVSMMMAIGIINLLVIPAFRNFFATFGATLPLPTRLLIACSDLFTHHGLVLFIITVCVALGMVIFLQLPEGKWWWSLCKLKIPFVGSIVERSIYARFCRAFAMTITAQVPLLHAFNIVGQVVDNHYLELKFLNMRVFVENGETFYLAAVHSTLFSPLILQMLAVGEETGKIDNTLLDVAHFYEKDVDYDLKRLGDVLEPLLIMIIASMVLILALGVFLPMWDISTVALKKMS